MSDPLFDGSLAGHMLVIYSVQTITGEDYNVMLSSMEIGKGDQRF